MIIGLAGRAGSGKDEVGRIIVDRYGFKRMAFADPLKQLLLKIDPWVVDDYLTELFPFGLFPSRLSSLVVRFGWDTVKKIPEVRRLLQATGEGAIQEIDSGVWVNPQMMRAQKFVDVVFTDARKPHEFDALKWQAPFHRKSNIIFVDRPDLPAPINASHESEKYVQDFQVGVANGWWEERIINTEGEGWQQRLEDQVSQIMSRWR